ncbi:unnamed protein product [Ectocarpus sp. CCAP 1310/34]|nr:unnamed protein product [Ectocarpus sp. CCAP 1310/34]
MRLPTTLLAKEGTMPNLRATKLYTMDQIRNSPSRKDGVSEALENDYRRTTGLFIKAAGKELELPVDAVATALVFFHKFFMLHSFQKHERFFVGSACLFLAAKVEESSKRVEQVMSKSWKVWNGGRDPPSENEKSFKRLREKILIAERCVLHTLGFQLTVEHPYSVVMSLLKKLFTMGKGADGGKGADKALNRQLSQAATSFVNDSLLTTLCLQYRPKQVAAAVVYLSYLYMGLPRVDTTLLEADVTVVANICDIILSLYDERGAGHATVVVTDLRDKLKQRIMKNTTAAAGSDAAGSGSTAVSPPPASATITTASPRPTPSSPRPTTSSSSSRATRDHASSPSLPLGSNNSSSSNNIAASLVDGGGVDKRGSSGVGGGSGSSDGGQGRGVAGRAVEDSRRHHHTHNRRDPRNSPSKAVVNPSAKRKSGDGDADLGDAGRSGSAAGAGAGAGAGAVDFKRRKSSASSFT